jgi:hypothetical protein
MLRFRLIADFEFDAPHAEGAAEALGAHFASLGMAGGESPISPDGRYLIECVDPDWVAREPPAGRAGTKRARDAVRERMMGGDDDSP